MPLNLTAEIQRAGSAAPVLRAATVIAVNANTVDVDYGGGAEVPGLNYLSSYSPTVDDVVIVAVSGGLSVVLGKTA